MPTLLPSKNRPLPHSLLYVYHRPAATPALARTPRVHALTIHKRKLPLPTPCSENTNGSLTYSKRVPTLEPFGKAMLVVGWSCFACLLACALSCMLYMHAWGWRGTKRACEQHAHVRTQVPWTFLFCFARRRAFSLPACPFPGQASSYYCVATGCAVRRMSYRMREHETCEAVDEDVCCVLCV